MPEVENQGNELILRGFTKPNKITYKGETSKESYQEKSLHPANSIKFIQQDLIELSFTNSIPKDEKIYH